MQEILHVFTSFILKVRKDVSDSVCVIPELTFITESENHCLLARD